MSKIELLGFDELGNLGQEGIRYAWRVDQSKYLLESASFINKTKFVLSDIAGYTTSVSLGCVLRYLGCSCKFCRTGNLLPFCRFLTAKEIAKQNIVMVLCDMHNNKHPDAKNKKREFAYMGQGEPGYSYVQLRMAIKITDYVLNNILKQKVHRHIIATSGISEMLQGVESDLKNGFYDSKITIHYSLHAGNNRSLIMPINNFYKFEDSVQTLKNISDITKEKVCLGVILFKNFRAKNTKEDFSTDISNIKEVLKFTDIDHFRFSFCEYNESSDVGTADLFPFNEAENINNYFRNLGYETKLFYSFGKPEQSACGMLAGQKPSFKIAHEWIELQKMADIFIEKACKEIENKDGDIY